jgi:hypothetical protein
VKLTVYIAAPAANGGTMDMPLWYWQLCFGALTVTLLLAREID